MKIVLMITAMLVSMGAFAEGISLKKVYFRNGNSGPSSYDQTPVKFINKINVNQPKNFVDFSEILSDQKESSLEVTENGVVRLIVEGRLVEVLGQASKAEYGQVLNLEEGVDIASTKSGSYPVSYSTCRAHFYSNRGVNLITEFKMQISKDEKVLIESEYKTYKNLFNIPSEIPLFCRE